MALESSGTILYVAKISYQSDNWFGNCQGGTKTVHTHTHTPAAHYISLVFLRKCRNKTKKQNTTHKKCTFHPLAFYKLNKIIKQYSITLAPINKFYIKNLLNSQTKDNILIENKSGIFSMKLACSQYTAVNTKVFPIWGILRRKKERMICGRIVLCVPVAQLVEHQCGKLEICGSNPS